MSRPIPEIGSLVRLIEKAETTRTMREDYLKGIESSMQADRDSQTQLSLVNTLFAEMMKKVSDRDLAKVDNLVNFGLSSIFPDREVSMTTSVDTSGKKLQVRIETFDGGEESAMDDHGSVSVVQSLILRVISIMKLKKPRFIMLDETLKALDNVYINNMSNFINHLAKKMGFDIILVTHNPGSADTTVLRVSLDEGNNLVLNQEGNNAASALN